MEIKFLLNCTIAWMILFCLVQKSRAQDRACMQQLLPCMDYINGTGDPPRSCCDPLKYVIKSKPECVCSMISIKGADQAERAGINLTNAQQLPGRCGEHINPLGCILGAPSSSSAGFYSRNPDMILTAASWMIVPILWAFFSMYLSSI